MESRSLARSVVVVAAVLLGAACNAEPPEIPLPSGSPPSTSPPLIIVGSRPVRLEASDGVHLAGREFGSGARGVVLLHMFATDQTDWFEFASVLAQHGYHALTLNFRGYCPGGVGGCSEKRRQNNFALDADAGVRYLRSHGAKRVVVLGADLGGYAALFAAGRADVPIDGIVVVSCQEQFIEDPGKVLSRIKAPKLFLAGENVPLDAVAAEDFYAGQKGRRRSGSFRPTPAGPTCSDRSARSGKPKSRPESSWTSSTATPRTVRPLASRRPPRRSGGRRPSPRSPAAPSAA